jgi:endogenous inhibitor of DNA gyrase (YacG/DUF329 family)
MAESTCPICKHAAEADRSVNSYAPFCSRRCKTIDLGRWLGEGYSIPVEEETPREEQNPVPPRREG